MSSRYDYLIPEVWRKVIVEAAVESTIMAKHLPVEHYDLAEVVHYFEEVTIANTPSVWKLGTSYPISVGTYEKKDVTLEAYANGLEIPKPAMDRIIKYGIGLNILQNEIRRKGEGMGISLDKRISDAIVAAAAAAENTVPLTTGNFWDTADEEWANVKASLALAKRMIKDDHYNADTLIISQGAEEVLLTHMPMVEAWGAQVAKEGKILRLAGLSVEVSDNLTTGNTAILFASNRFGRLYESYPLTTVGPKYYEEEFVYRAWMYYMNGVVIDTPNATCTITSAFTET